MGPIRKRGACAALVIYVMATQLCCVALAHNVGHRWSGMRDLFLSREVTPANVKNVLRNVRDTYDWSRTSHEKLLQFVHKALDMSVILIGNSSFPAWEQSIEKLRHVIQKSLEPSQYCGAVYNLSELDRGKAPFPTEEFSGEYHADSLFVSHGYYLRNMKCSYEAAYAPGWNKTDVHYDFYGAKYFGTESQTESQMFTSSPRQPLREEKAWGLVGRYRGRMRCTNATAELILPEGFDALGPVSLLDTLFKSNIPGWKSCIPPVTGVISVFGDFGAIFETVMSFITGILSGNRSVADARLLHYYLSTTELQNASICVYGKEGLAHALDLALGSLDKILMCMTMAGGPSEACFQCPALVKECNKFEGYERSLKNRGDLVKMYSSYPWAKASMASGGLPCRRPLKTCDNKIHKKYDGRDRCKDMYSPPRNSPNHGPAPGRAQYAQNPCRRATPRACYREFDKQERPTGAPVPCEGMYRHREYPSYGPDYYGSPYPTEYPSYSPEPYESPYPTLVPCDGGRDYYRDSNCCYREFDEQGHPTGAPVPCDGMYRHREYPSYGPDESPYSTMGPCDAGRDCNYGNDHPRSDPCSEGLGYKSYPGYPTPNSSGGYSNYPYPSQTPENGNDRQHPTHTGPPSQSTGTSSGGGSGSGGHGATHSPGYEAEEDEVSKSPESSDEEMTIEPTPDVETTTPVTTSTPATSTSTTTSAESTTTTTTSSGSGAAACFPAHAIVEREGSVHTRMEDLRVGDKIRTVGGEFSPVLLFTHADGGIVTEMVRLSVRTARNSSLTVRLSAGHYLHANGRLTAAEALRRGDAVRVSECESCPVHDGAVVAVDRSFERGLYNPQTANGLIAVDGIVCSTYTTAVNPSLARTLLLPLKMMSSATNLHLSILSRFFQKGAPGIVRVLESLSLSEL